MSLVYVHGIGNRLGMSYEAGARLRDGLFRRLFLPTVFPGRAEVVIVAPYWGSHASALRWNLASLPVGGLESLGPADEVTTILAETLSGSAAGSDAALLTMAHESMADAVDVLYTLVEPGDSSLPMLLEFAEEVVRYCRFRESLYPREPEPVRYPWLGVVSDDLAWLDRLVAEVQAFPEKTSVRHGDAGVGPTETLGGGGAVRDCLAAGLRKLRQNPVARLSGPTIGLARRVLGPRLALLVGDVLAYLAQRGTVCDPGPIVQVVASAIENAMLASGPEEPVVVVAHSMGGNIVYDLLSHYRTDLRVDVFVTVGSQVGLFEELKLFRASNMAIPHDAVTHAPVPPTIRRWINVVDRSDPLAFRAGPVFDGAVDYVYPSGSLWAHTAYLRQPHFHARLARRVAEVLS